MITPGKWQLAGADTGEPMTRDHPGDPGHPAYIYVTREDQQEVTIALVMEPTYMARVEGDPEGYAGDMGEVPAGDWTDNAQLMTFSPALVRFVQKLAAIVDGGIITAQYRDEAKALLKQLAAVEVTSDADRW